MGILMGMLMGILMGTLMGIFMGIFLIILMEILIGILMGILMMGWPYDSSDCLLKSNIHIWITRLAIFKKSKHRFFKRTLLCLGLISGHL